MPKYCFPFVQSEALMIVDQFVREYIIKVLVRGLGRWTEIRF